MDLLLIASGSIKWNANHLFSPVFSVGDMQAIRKMIQSLSTTCWSGMIYSLPQKAVTCAGFYNMEVVFDNQGSHTEFVFCNE